MHGIAITSFYMARREGVNLRYDIAVYKKIISFSDVTFCGLVEIDQSFRGTFQKMVISFLIL